MAKEIVIDEAMIRERAYLIWEREGRPFGRDTEHWLQAHWELIGEAAAAEADSAETAAPDGEIRAEAEPPAKKTRKRKQAEEEPQAEEPPAEDVKPKRKAAAKAAKAKADSEEQVKEKVVAEPRPKRSARKKSED